MPLPMDGLSDRLMPLELRSVLSGPVADFMVVFGHAPLLCVELAPAATELEGGLLGAAAEPGTRSTGPLAFHTVGMDPAAAASRAAHGVNPRALATRLGARRHFVLPLAKRSSQTLSEDRIAAGRARNVDIVLRDGSVSKSHAWFEVDAHGTVMVADAGSKNGTWLRDQRLPPRELVALPYGEPLKLGSVVTFVCEPTTLWQAVNGHA